VKRLLNQFRDPRGKFIDAQGVGDLRADFAHEVQLIEPKPFYCHAMGGDETHSHHACQSLQQVQFLLFEIGSLCACDLERSQSHPLIFERDRSPGPVRGAGFCLPFLLDVESARFQRALHPGRDGLGRK
jgi:hypothetical protein